MNTKKRVVLAGGVLALALFCWVLSANAVAGGGSGVMGRDEARPMVLRTLMKLDLTQDQKHQIAGILKAERSKIKEQVAVVISARKTLFETTHSEVFDEAAVRSAAKAAANAEEELAVSRARVVSELKAVLTAEQKAVLQDTRLAREKKIKQRIEKAESRIDHWIDKNS